MRSRLLAIALAPFIVGCIATMVWDGVSPLALADQPPTLTRDWIVPAQAIPTTATSIGALVTDGNPPPNTTISVCQLDISVAPGTSAVNITIADQQSTPYYFLQAVPITPTSATQGTTWNNVIRASAPLGCKVFLGGMTVRASAAGATIAVSGRW